MGLLNVWALKKVRNAVEEKFGKLAGKCFVLVS